MSRLTKDSIERSNQLSETTFFITCGNPLSKVTLNTVNEMPKVAI
ncbi:MAG TPA: hypothetical protein VD815_10315 [Candidatus Saccharimonadales bacterium]|nr:hypothetical protein [Candidatus Saccharimonadales bacterium]